MQTLKEWMAENKKGVREMADLLGCSAATISKYCAGKQWPGPLEWRKIGQITGGAVTPNDHLSLYEEDKGAA